MRILSHTEHLKPVTCYIIISPQFYGTVDMVYYNSRRIAALFKKKNRRVDHFLCNLRQYGWFYMTFQPLNVCYTIFLATYCAIPTAKKMFDKASPTRSRVGFSNLGLTKGYGKLY